MKVFISWSGDKSRDIAEALRDWLPSVLHAVDPFVSAKDLDFGSRWQTEIAEELEGTNFGLICVTRENLRSEWLNFEAGALAKSVENSRLVPLTIDLAPADIENPLAQFQAMRLVQGDLQDLLKTMNVSCSSPIADTVLDKTFRKWWPDLESEISKISEKDYGTPNVDLTPKRDEREVLEEVLETVRGLARNPVSSHRKLRRHSADPDEFSHDLARLVPISHPSAWSATITDDDRCWLELDRPPTPELAEVVSDLEMEHGVLIRVVPEGGVPDSVVPRTKMSGHG